ncbi:hypothetical protein SHELI_v1c10030 [Spiroplasma helicoides]|uniref:Uncharacterized protein n=1 Tax=Spiroplasma helicoides TaxID=216938 RepID=A0A1B3SM14_9MOLU|nr:lipoprotein [Spiroplasma helicoides]AOG60950.1 hypothetical protein SHELI_v1c10030 [Spiroplasma helicoides]
MKKLLSLLAATGLVATSGSVAVACNKKADDKGTATTKKDLSALAKKELGEIQLGVDETMPSVKELVAAVNKTNASYGLGESDVEIAKSPAQTVTGATLTAKSTSTKFTGSVAVTYTVKAFAKLDLSTAITGADLTVAPTANDETAAKTAVLAQINSKLSITAKETDDVVFSGFSAATDASHPGQIVATAADSSKLLTAKKAATFVLTFKAGDTPSTTPVIGAQQDVTMKMGESSNKKELTVSVTNVVSGKALTATSADDTTVSVAVEAASTKADGSYKVTLTSKKAGGPVEITLKYDGASDVKFNVTVQAAEAAQTPVLTFGESLQSGATVDLANKEAKTITVNVAHPKTDKKITAAKGQEAGAASLTVGEVTGTNGATSYTFTLTASAKITTEQGVTVTVSYDGAQAITLKVTATNVE